MKKSLKLAVAASVLATPAMAANLENPLYLPESGDFYSKTGAGVMYKVTDDTDANKLKDHAGATEFPIWPWLARNLSPSGNGKPAAIDPNPAGSAP